MTIMSVHKPNY